MPPRPPLRAWRPFAGWAALTLLLVWSSIWVGCGSTGSAPVPARGSGRSGLAPSRTGPAQQTPPRSPAPAGAWAREADRWLGTPYRLGGNDRRGIDCSGFALQLHRSVSGSPLPRSTADQFRQGRPVSRRELRPGDLVFFDTGGRGVSHVGVIVGPDRFAHASTSRGVMYSRLSEDYWNRRYLGARRP